MLLLFHVHLEIVISKKRYLIIPGLNQSLGLYDFLKSPEYILDIVEFPCNGKDKDEYLKFPLNRYGEFLPKNIHYDTVFCHSLGSLVFLTSRSEISFSYDQVYLIAPALKTWALAEFFFKILPDKLVTPSLNMPSRRAFSFCSVGLYYQVILLQKKLESIELDGSHISVVHDPRDELIRYNRLFDNFHYIEYLSIDFPRHLSLDFIEKCIKV